LQDLVYTHDAVGNIVQVADGAQQTAYFAGTVTSGTQQFEYDALYRLTHATGREQPGQVGFALGGDGYPEAPITSIPHRNDLQALLPYVEDYTYDAVGNLLSTAHAAGNTGWTRTQTTVAGTNRIATVSLPGDPQAGPYTGIFDHDPAGNLTRIPNLSAMSWDHAGRFVEANLGGGGTAYFTYDQQGQRVRKVVERGGKRLERIYIGRYERYRELTGSSLTVTLERESLHVADGERRFTLIETKTVDTSVASLTPTPLFRFQLPNNLGSACVEVDETGAVLSYEEYYPYGGTSFRSGDIDKRYRYAGKERDEETGLYYVGARYYAPWLGRWTSADPAGLVDGTNLYRYVRNNPIRLSDPAGMLGEGDVEAPVEVAVAIVKFTQDFLANLGARAPLADVAPVTPVVTAPAVAAPAAASVAAPGGAGAVAAAGIFATGAAIAGTGWLSFFRQNNVAQFGNVWGVSHPGMEILEHNLQPLPTPTPTPVPVPQPQPQQDPDRNVEPKPKPDDDNAPRLGRIYVTYTKYNVQTGKTYSGRTSAVVDLTKPLEPQARSAVARREGTHHINIDEEVEPKGRKFLPAELDKFLVGRAVVYKNRYQDVAYWAIRGREQQLIDHHGGAHSDQGTSANPSRGVVKENTNGPIFHWAANTVWGELHQYTGY
jgi:RHS repeat-associated protein